VGKGKAGLLDLEQAWKGERDAILNNWHQGFILFWTQEGKEGGIPEY